MENNNNNYLNSIANVMGIAVGGIQLFAMVRALKHEKEEKEEDLEERVTTDDVVRIARRVAKAECSKTADMLMREIKKLDVNGLNESIKELNKKIDDRKEEKN